MAEHRLVWLTVIDQDPSPLKAQLAGLDFELEFVLSPDAERTAQAVQDADVILTVGVPLRTGVLGQAKQLQAILSQGHGFDHIDIETATRQGIMVVNTPGFCTEEVSSHALALLLACARQIVSLDRRMRNGEWKPDLWSRIDPIPPLVGQVLGLVGFGGIARLFTRKAQVLGLEIIAYDPYIPPWIAQEYRVELVPELDELARRSDFVSIHVPSDAGTRGMLDDAFFRAMKPTAFLVNTGRGKTVDEAALVAALREGQIAGAGLDVFEEEPLSSESPLMQMENVVLTPHSAGLSDAIWNRGATIMGQEAARIFRGEWPMSLVNPLVRERLAPRRPPTSSARRSPPSPSSPRNSRARCRPTARSPRMRAC
jgi:D-3-phosphoglycerate dehydrogenase